MAEGSKKTRLIIEILIVICLVVSFLACCFLPVKLETVPMTNVLYEYQNIKSSDVKVSKSSLFGFSQNVTDYEIQDLEDDCINVSSGYLHQKYRLNIFT